MKTENRVLGILVVLVAVFTALLPILSWMLSAFGLPFHDMLSDEGWRWFFLHFPDSAFNHFSIIAIAFFMAMGAIQRSGILQAKPLDAPFLWTAALFLIMLAYLLWGALSSHSPLLSVTGRLYMSTYIYGIPSIGMMCTTIASCFYGMLSAQSSHLRLFAGILTYGLRRYAICILLVLQLTYLYECIRFVMTPYQ